MTTPGGRLILFQDLCWTKEDADSTTLTEFPVNGNLDMPCDVNIPLKSIGSEFSALVNWSDYLKFYGKTTRTPPYDSHFRQAPPTLAYSSFHVHIDLCTHRAYILQ